MAGFGRTVRRAVVMVGTLAFAGTGAVALSAPAGAVTVTDETSFRAAWSNATETKIDLAADITLTCGGGGTAQRNSTTALIIDGHGHSITQTCANSIVVNNPFGVSMFRNVTITGANAPNTVGGAMSQPITVEVRKRHKPRKHQPSPHQQPAPAASVPAVVRFTG